MSNIVHFPKGQLSLDIQEPAVWGMILAYTDPTFPLPTNRNTLNEVQLLAGQAKLRLDALVERLQAKAFEVDKSTADETPPF